MKTILIISAICICVGALSIKDFQNAIRIGQSICMAKTGINKQIINDVNDGKINIEDENVQLYIECAMKKFNFVDKDGNFNEHVSREIAKIFLNENEINQLITECSAISDTNVHLKITKIFQCITKFKTINDILNS
ncbi:odorant binding protein 15 precursor [Apis mellifera caucasica]|nr:odorant binding protein 15 precursor [Apis mellifera caucasica]KAG9428695.1 odorant binding protein 15 precursor [Apis mellifera carnica]